MQREHRMQHAADKFDRGKLTGDKFERGSFGGDGEDMFDP
jgi:hypothetical protein